ncbi:methylosome protein WDR77 [Linepithema humile]|uniref:methylosome protein WDR77 n=1 Tax=Linepithema humile TaxID=83485 RepID=UPI0006239F36|nr:PREDICTED: methylosome protein 50 [Linepithema humile]
MENTMENWNVSSDGPFRNMSVTDRPSIVKKNLQFLLIYNEHNALLGGTNMVDIYWTGTLWHYNDILDFTREKADITQQTDSGVCNAVYLTQNKFVVVEDSGIVEILEIIQASDQKPQFYSLERTCQHDDSVLTVSKFSNERNIVTGGMDCCLKVWDVEDLIATYSYSFAHTDVITSTDVKAMSTSVFVSTSLDGESLLWDVRRAKPAHCIFKKDDCQLTAVAWNSISDHLVAVGAADGSITLIDIRQTDDVLCESVECDRGIHKLLFNPDPEKKDELACCSDDTSVKVFDSYKEMLPIFEDSSHSDFVRGLAWHKDGLFSCSWDGTVIKHVILSSNDNIRTGPSQFKIKIHK